VLKERSFVVCSNCSKQILPHRACPFCGFYKGRSVITIKIKGTKKDGKAKQEKKTDKKERKGGKKKSLSAEKLSGGKSKVQMTNVKSMTKPKVQKSFDV